MSALKIKVAKKHIDNAIQNDSHHCMIADAIQEHFGERAKYIMVDVQSIRFTDMKKGVRHVFLTPPVAQKSLIKFDKGEEVKPFTFNAQQEITRPMQSRTRTDESYVNREKRYGRKAKGKKRGRKPGVKYGRRVTMPKQEREYGLRAFTK